MPETTQYAVHEMEQALEHLSEGTDAIVDDALDLAKTILACRQMSHPKALVTLQACDVSELAGELDAAMVRGEFQGSVQADPEILTRILSHLARAAWEQSPQEELPTLHLRAQCDDQLTIEVRAASSGIWHESYVTLEQGTTASQGLDCQNRLELSLAFCKHAMDLMGGSIGVEASSENGLRFWLTLPAAAPQILPNIVPFAAELLPYDAAASR